MSASLWHGTDNLHRIGISWPASCTLSRYLSAGAQERGKFHELAQKLCICLILKCVRFAGNRPKREGL